MMKALAISAKGLEKELAEEVMSLLPKLPKSKKRSIEAIPYGVVFDIDSLESLARFTYLSQCSERIMLLLQELPLKDYSKLKDKIDKKEFAKYLKARTFESRCITFNGSFEKTEVESDVGEIIHESLSLKVNLDSPDLTVLSFINETTFYLGIDFSCKDFHKRDYKIFVNKESLRATVAASMLRIADIKDDDAILDPFCRSGEILIEAALVFSGRSTNFYNKDKFRFQKIPGLKDFDFQKIDKKIKSKIDLDLIGYDSMMNNVAAAKKNAKIAGVEKNISFSRVDVEWLDTKFKKDEIDKIITKIPEISKYSVMSEVMKQYKELFYEANYILKPKGLIVLVCRKNNKDIEQAATKENFVLKEKKEILMGKEELNVLIYSKKS